MLVAFESAFFLLFFLLGRRARLRFVSRENEQNKTSNAPLLLVPARHVVKRALLIGPSHQARPSFSN